MDWKELPNSSNIASAAYDEATKELHVRFRNGGTYAYKDVPGGSLEGLVHADSAGKYLHGLKGSYEHRKIEEK